MLNFPFTIRKLKNKIQLNKLDLSYSFNTYKNVLNVLKRTGSLRTYDFTDSKFKLLKCLFELVNL